MYVYVCMQSCYLFTNSLSGPIPSQLGLLTKMEVNPVTQTHTHILMHTYIQTHTHTHKHHHAQLYFHWTFSLNFFVSLFFPSLCFTMDETVIYFSRKVSALYLFMHVISESVNCVVYVLFVVCCFCFTCLFSLFIFMTIC